MSSNEEKLAVSIVTFQGSGGMAHYAEMLVTAMERLAYAHLVVVGMPDELRPYSTIPRFVAVRRRERRLIRRVFEAYNVFFYRRVARLICQQATPQVVHITSGVTGLLGFCKELWRHGVSIVYTVHDPLPHEERRTLWGTLFSAYQRRFQLPAVLRLCAAVHVHGKEHRQQLIDLYGSWVADKVYVAPHGAGVPRAILTGRRKPPELDGVGSDGALTLLFFGRLEPYKGLDVLIEAVRTLEERGCNIRVVVAGNGELGLDGNTVLPKCITLIHRFVADDEIRHIFESADLVVLPYKSATQSGVIPMAYAFGKPVVATDVGALRDVVEPGRTGLLVQPSEPVALANAIEELARDRARLAWLSGNTTQFLNEYLAWGRVVTTHVDRYRKVVTAERRTAGVPRAEQVESRE